MDTNEKKAFELIAEAEKTMKGSFFSNLFGGSGKADDAIALYERAGNSFKMAKKWHAAGSAFCSASRLSQQQKSKHDAATHLVEAANCFKKVDPNEAIRCLLSAIQIYTEMGRFTIAAKHHLSIAEIFESELAEVDKALQHYQQAGDYYSGEESTSAANKCFLKVASLSAQLEHYQKASELFDQVGRAAMESNLLRYGAKDHLFRAVVCQLCIDPHNGQKAVSAYEEVFPMFVDSREYKLLKKLLDAIENESVDEFTEAVRDYDSLSRMDPWLTSLLLKIKKSIDGDLEDLR